MSTKERRPKVALKLPVIPIRDDGFAKEEQHPLPLPLPLPLPAPVPLPLPANSQLSKPNDTSKSRGSLCPSSRSLNGASSPNEEIDPEDTVRMCTLGHGSSGKVYKVRHKTSGKIYALKVIQEKHEPSVRKQIMREMDILQRARSPYVVRCYGSADKGGEISFILEYMDGGSLANVLKSRKLVSEPYLAEVARQVLKGLHYLHINKIVHRDIKPSNLLINHKKEVKIADFGVSTILASTLAPCNSFVGTCAYMSPERFDPDSHGGNYSGYAADIWSLGLTLLECATGHFPFLSPGQQADWPTLMLAICYREPPSAPDHASPQFKDFINVCLQKDPKLRPRACALLSHPFITRGEGNQVDLSILLQSLSI